MTQEIGQDECRSHDPDPVAVRDLALAYHSAGIVVVPVHPPTNLKIAKGSRGKAPKYSGWQKATPTTEQVERWFSLPSNLGVACGKRSGFVCIDIDERNGGLRWLFEQEHRLGHFIRETTGGGGFHLFFRYPEGVERIPSFTGKDGLAEGVELKADGGHQVITAPSIHENGRPYVFEHGLDLTYLDAEADEFPRWLLDIALELEKRPRKPLPESTVGFAGDDQELRRARDALSRLGFAIEGQGGDHRTYIAACVGVNYGIKPDVWWPVLREWNKDCQPPWEEKALKKKLDGAYRYAVSDAGSKTVAAMFPDDITDAAEQPKLSTEEAERQADDLGLRAYVHTNPVRSASRFLSETEGYFYSQEYHHRYRNDTWQIVETDYLRAEIDRAIVESNPGVSLKDSHVREIICAMQRSCYLQEVVYDKWADGRRGDFVRVANGILDLNRITLESHSKDWLSCTKLPFPYEPDARCPTFEAFLDSVWGDTPDQIEALQLWFGYLLSSKTNQQKFLTLIGPPRSGKGTVLRVMTRLLGDPNCKAMTVNALGGRFGLGDAIGKRLLVLGDAHEGSREAANGAAETIKLITGEDPVVIEKKYRDISTAKLQCKIVVAANEMPRLIDIRGSIAERMVLLEMTRSFAGREDLSLDEKLHGEMSGILNWAIEGLEKLNAAGKLLRPESSSAKLLEIRDTLNPTEAFFKDYIEIVPEDSTDDVPSGLFVNDAYNLYRVWGHDGGHRPLSKARFSAILSDFLKKHPHVTKAVTPRSATEPRRLTFFTSARLACRAESLQAAINSGSLLSFPADGDADDDDPIPF